ncbi:MAG: YwmB family TATA-box binding protein [Bacilli bacterium]
MKKLALMGLAVLLTASYLTGQTMASVWRPGAGRTVPFLTKAFDATHSRLTGFEVHDWSTLHDGFSSVAVLTRDAKRVAQEMGVSSPHLYTHDGSRDHVAVWSGFLQSGKGTVRMQATVQMASLSFPHAPAQTVLILRLLASGPSYPGERGGRLPVRSSAPGSEMGLFRDFAAAYRTVRTAAAASGGNAVVNATLFGVIPALLNTAHRGAVVRAAYAAVHAQPLQAMVYAYTTSIAGYAASGGSPALAGSQRINLQVALHENSYNRSTRVLVGSPIITVEY